MSNYTISKLNKVTYLINDSLMCSTFVIIGENKAMVIDCGMANDESLINQVQKITNKELEIVLTHAHYDHIGHVDEFDHFYLAKEDELCLKNRPINRQKWKILTNHMEFDLGGICIQAFILKGHTMGSTIFVDKTNHQVFCGDEFGSGCGVWMQVYEACCLSDYIKTIDQFIAILSSFDYPLEAWVLHGGHVGQEYTSRLGSYNPLNMQLVLNLKELSKKLLQNEIKLQECDAESFTGEQSYYASYLTAEMVIRKSLIK